MTLAAAPLAHRQRGEGIAVDIPALLAALALTGLLLAPRIGSLGALVFLAGGAALALSNLRHSARTLFDHWYVILPLAGYCLASTLWSQYPGETLRASLQLAATIAIAIVIATRVPPRTLVRVLFWMLLLSLIASALIGRVRDDNGAWVGIFGSKNAFAGIVSTFAVTAVVSLADRAASLMQRGVALGGLILAGPMLLLAQSAGALLTLAPAIAVSLLVLASGWFSARQKAVALVLVALAVLAALMIAAGYWDAIQRLVLVATGKDATLTGRTELWDMAMRLIGDHPLFGVGYRAFWVQGNPLAEALWIQFGIASRSGFTFHSAYMTNAVEIGLVGVAIQIAILAAAAIALARWCLRWPGAAPAFFAGYLTLAIGNSFVESAFFYQFSLPTIFIIAGLVYALHVVRR